MMIESPTNSSDVLDVIRRLLRYCEAHEWSGIEPYDALNSHLFAEGGLFDHKLCRLVATQLLKRSPINLRAILKVKPSTNPKALGLFLTSLVRLEKAGSFDVDAKLKIIDRLVELRSPGEKQWCWGYNFPWQTRTVLVPRWSPNLVCTTFAAFGLLDVFDRSGDARLLDMGASAAQYLLDELYWEDSDGRCGFAYPTVEARYQIHNANLLASALCLRVSRLTGDSQFVDRAEKVARYSAEAQNPDGGWFYGELLSQRWIDNFHTGFNLGALLDISRFMKAQEFDERVSRGYDYFKKTFLRPDGSVRYYSHETYPIDAHCIAQTLITLSDFSKDDPTALSLAGKAFEWSVKNLWDEKSSCFWYRKYPCFTIKTSYMRWTQVWMLLGLVRYWEALREQEVEGQTKIGGNYVVA